MAVNKVVMNTENGEQTLIDLTRDTATPETLMAGYTAHGANGEPIVGTLHAPVRGVDYWTEADQEAIVQQVITALGTPVFGRVDLDKRITLSTEHLVGGTYYLGYNDDDGKWVQIGKLINSADIPVPLTWVTSMKLDSSTGKASADTANKYAYTEGIPIESGMEYVVYCSDRTSVNCFLYFYDASGGFVGKYDWMDSSYTDQADPYGPYTIQPLSGAASFRLRSNVTEANAWYKLERLSVIKRYV